MTMNAGHALPAIIPEMGAPPNIEESVYATCG